MTTEWEFFIPDVPPSYNAQFKINYRIKQVYLSREAKQFVYLTKLSIPRIPVNQDKVYTIAVKFYQNWYYQNGKIKKQDIQNMDKLLIDAVFERMGVDDSLLWEVHLYKIQSSKVYTKVTIKEIECPNSESTQEKNF